MVALFLKDIRIWSKRSTCDQPTSSYFLSYCTNCLGVSNMANHLKLLLEKYEVEQITQSQWIGTDR